MMEVITHVEFHPRRSDLFIFSSSKGYMSLCDLRESSDFSHNSIKYKAKEETGKHKFFSSIVKAMTRAKFAPSSDNYIFSRDYLSVQIWDVRNNSSCVQTLNVTDYLDQCLLDVYESERIFDKFDLQISPCSTMALTGSYGNNAHIIDMMQRQNTTIGVQFIKKRGQHLGVVRTYKGRRIVMGLEAAINDIMAQKVPQKLSSNGNGLVGGGKMDADETSNSQMKHSELLKQLGDPRKDLIERNLAAQIQHCAWHPSKNTVAIAKNSSLFLYTERRDSSAKEDKQQ